MGFVTLLAVAVVAWLYFTGKLGRERLDDIAALALAAVGIRMAATGRPLPAALLVGLAAGWWLWRRRRSPPMPVAEAHALLGIDASADAEAIRAAHRRLIAKVHPDKGGTPELAQRINAARDIALRAVNQQPSRSS